MADLTLRCAARARLRSALESRGPGVGPRTTWRPVPLDGRELLATGVVAAVALVLAVGGG